MATQKRNALGRGLDALLSMDDVIAMTMYQPYIDGEKEIAQINMEFRSGLVK